MSDMTQTLETLLALADTLDVCEWNHPLMSAEACREAVRMLECLTDENEELRAEIAHRDERATRRWAGTPTGN